MYQKLILPQADSLLERYGQTDKQTDRFQHPIHPYIFLFSTKRAGPTRYPQAQLKETRQLTQRACR
jgi:hypothetical protein